MSQTTKNHKPVFLEQPKDPIVWAFECMDGDGQDAKMIPHYQYVDPFKTPAMRGVQALTVYEEFRTRTSREMYLLETEAEMVAITASKQALTGSTGKINLVEAAEHLTNVEKILRNRTERMKMVYDPDLVYKLASVVFFDETENPYRYDMRYNMDVKIPRWKKYMGTEKDFFLLQPLGRLIPYLKQYEDDSLTYSQVAMTILQKQSEFLSTILSKRQSIRARAQTTS